MNVRRRKQAADKGGSQTTDDVAARNESKKQERNVTDGDEPLLKGHYKTDSTIRTRMAVIVYRGLLPVVGWHSGRRSSPSVGIEKGCQIFRNESLALEVWMERWLETRQWLDVLWTRVELGCQIEWLNCLVMFRLKRLAQPNVASLGFEARWQTERIRGEKEHIINHMMGAEKILKFFGVSCGLTK
jgi:hypothetical protein